MVNSSTSYRKKRQAGDTTVIRVPREFAPCLLELARRWDAGDRSVVKELGGTLELDDLPRTSVKYLLDLPVGRLG